jgi:hypothetical protein
MFGHVSEIGYNHLTTSLFTGYVSKPITLQVGYPKVKA